MPWYVTEPQSFIIPNASASLVNCNRQILLDCYINVSFPINDTEEKGANPENSQVHIESLVISSSKEFEFQQEFLIEPPGF